MESLDLEDIEIDGSHCLVFLFSFVMRSWDCSLLNDICLDTSPAFITKLQQTFLLFFPSPLISFPILFLMVRKG